MVVTTVGSPTGIAAMAKATALLVYSFGVQDLIGAERMPRELAGRWRPSRSRCIRQSRSQVVLQ